MADTTQTVTQAIDTTATNSADAAVTAAAAALSAEAAKVSPGLSVIAVPLIGEAAQAFEKFLATEIPIVVQDVENEAANIGTRIESWFKNVFKKL